MTDWCHEFDFTKDHYDFTGNIAASGRGDRAFYSPPPEIPSPEAVIGWIAANNFRGLVQIQSLPFPEATLTSFTMTISSPMNGSFQKMEITIPDSNGSDSFVYMGSDLVGMIPFHDGVTTHSFFLGACSDLNNPGQAYTGAITQLVVTGTPALLMTVMLTRSPQLTLQLCWPRWATVPAAGRISSNRCPLRTSAP